MSKGKLVKRLTLHSHWFSAFVYALCSTAIYASQSPSNYQQCQSCHVEQHQKWQQSDHAHSMALATDDTVLGDFNKSSAVHHSLRGHFFKNENGFKTTITEAGKDTTYKVEYTFGHYPLQQYLVATEKGKYQVLPFAWDARDKSVGGQRWYHMYDEEIAPDDRLHWLQPIQNWNGMCADCHSGGLKRHFDIKTQTFNTEFTEINVGCLSCHDGKQQEHAATKTPTQTKGRWQRSQGQDVAIWSGAPRDNQYEESCYACHGVRTPLTDGFNSKTAFLDQFTPSWIAPPLYHVDGQILEEVFVYGSFKQSKMAQMGVTCIDCHDPHSGQLKKPGNDVCLQCHAPEKYVQKSHHQHDLKSTGGQCINCHMPKSNFMGIDARGDHSFKMPRPEFTLEYGVPNVCTDCHEDKDPQWALAQINQWHPKRQEPSQTEIAAINLYASFSFDSVKKVADDIAQPAIKRGNAIALLINVQNVRGDLIASYLKDAEPLVRLAATQVGERMSESEKRHYLPPLLSDKYKAIRVAAANAMIGILPESKWQQAFENAFKELQTSLDVVSWRGEGLVMRGNLKVRTGNLSEATFTYETSIVTDPYFVPAYINLADIYRQYGHINDEASTFELGIKRNPDNASLRYAYALHFVRTKALANTLIQVTKAMNIEPQNPQYAYLYLLALESLGKKEQALLEIDILISKVRDNRQLRALKEKWMH